MKTADQYTSKRKQLLAGSWVTCKMNINSHEITRGDGLAFKQGHDYFVPIANNIKDEFGHYHTWDLNCFVEVFTELAKIPKAVAELSL